MICAPITIAYFASVLMFPDFDNTTEPGVYFAQNFQLIGGMTGFFILFNLGVSLILGSAVLLSMPTLIRFVISVTLLTIAIFNLKKLVKPAGIVIFILILIGSKSFALSE